MSEFQRRRNEYAIALIAANIRRHRQKKKLTIQQLAFLVDIDYSQVSRMERGKVNFSVSLIFDIAKALEIPPSWLMEEEGANDEQR
jgi:transcriptional regulator with XRE-family HTH domain